MNFRLNAFIETIAPDVFGAGDIFLCRFRELYGADFRGADLRAVLLERISYDEATRWPEGFEVI